MGRKRDQGFQIVQCTEPNEGTLSQKGWRQNRGFSPRREVVFAFLRVPGKGDSFTLFLQSARVQGGMDLKGNQEIKKYI